MPGYDFKIALCRGTACGSYCGNLLDWGHSTTSYCGLLVFSDCVNLVDLSG